MNEHWVRFALSPDVTATVLFTAQPSADDLAALNEMLEVQIRVLRRADGAAGADRAPAGEVEPDALG